MKKITSLIIAFFTITALQAQTPIGQPTDTLARDLSDLENKMASEGITMKTDTAYYGVRKQYNFNALDYSLDGRHRYQGDRWIKGNLVNIHFWISEQGLFSINTTTITS